jgi:hypothetical protein
MIIEAAAHAAEEQNLHREEGRKEELYDLGRHCD